MTPDIHILEPFPAPDAARVTGDYGSFSDPISFEELPDIVPTIGSVVAIRPRTETSRAELRSLCEAVADRVVNAPIVLWIDRANGQRLVRMLTGDSGLPVRAVLKTSRPNMNALRIQLADPDRFPSQAVRWLRRRHDLDATTIEILTLMAEAVPGPRTLQDLLAQSNVPKARWRRHFAARELGSPSAWYQALRVTRMAIALQREPGICVEKFAIEFGFSSLSAFSDRIEDVVEVRPRFVRAHLGWEWMLFTALRRLHARL